MKLDNEAIIAAIEAVRESRELRLSDTSTARRIVEAYLRSVKSSRKRKASK